MTPTATPEAPAPLLLSGERRTQIETWAKTLQRPPANPAAVRDGQMLEELLAHCDAQQAAFDAYRESVATNLQALHDKLEQGYLDDNEGGHPGGLDVADTAKELGIILKDYPL